MTVDITPGMSLLNRAQEGNIAQTNYSSARLGQSIHAAGDAVGEGLHGIFDRQRKKAEAEKAKNAVKALGAKMGMDTEQNPEVWDDPQAAMAAIRDHVEQQTGEDFHTATEGGAEPEAGGMPQPDAGGGLGTPPAGKPSSSGLDVGMPPAQTGSGGADDTSPQSEPNGEGLFSSAGLGIKSAATAVGSTAGSVVGGGTPPAAPAALPQASPPSTVAPPSFDLGAPPSPAAGTDLPSGTPPANAAAPQPPVKPAASPTSGPRPSAPGGGAIDYTQFGTPGSADGSAPPAPTSPYAAPTKALPRASTPKPPAGGNPFTGGTSSPASPTAHHRALSPELQMKARAEKERIAAAGRTDAGRKFWAGIKRNEPDTNSGPLTASTFGSDEPVTVPGITQKGKPRSDEEIGREFDASGYGTPGKPTYAAKPVDESLSEERRARAAQIAGSNESREKVAQIGAEGRKSVAETGASAKTSGAKIAADAKLAINGLDVTDPNYLKKVAEIHKSAMDAAANENANRDAKTKETERHDREGEYLDARKIQNALEIAETKATKRADWDGAKSSAAALLKSRIIVMEAEVKDATPRGTPTPEQKAALDKMKGDLAALYKKHAELTGYTTDMNASPTPAAGASPPPKTDVGPAGSGAPKGDVTPPAGDKPPAPGAADIQGTDSGFDYDYPAAKAAGAQRDASGHLPDTFKQPWHPTFSTDSAAAKTHHDLAGTWTSPTDYVETPAHKFMMTLPDDGKKAFAALKPEERAEVLRRKGAK